MRWPPWGGIEADGGRRLWGGTHTPRYRWKYLSSAVSLGLALGYPIALAGGWLRPDALGGGTWSAVTTGWLMAVVYAVGTETYREVREARSDAGELGDRVDRLEAEVYGLDGPDRPAPPGETGGRGDG